MNKSSLKKFATNARLELLEKVELQARRIGITADSIKKADIESSDAIYIDGRLLSNTERNQRNKLISRIKEIGFERVMEETSYTWFNRFVALRYMEVNDYLPTRVRVLSSETDSAEPDMMKEALSLDLELDKEKVYEYKLNNQTDELFKYLIKVHCNDLNRYMPFMFETVESYTEILFPEGLLGTNSFVRQMVDKTFIPENNWENVEVVGWLYQYYIADEKARVFKEEKYKTSDIPFVTQLFTPDWIVKYMVQNSLGKYWIEAHPEHEALKKDWEFYLENEDKNYYKVAESLINKELDIEDIKCFDPAMGSGHILVYMFDILYEIYSKSGYTEREIPRLIIEKNLYGLDIDDRAYQLAGFSIVMKALQYNRRFLSSIERNGLKLNLAAIQETKNLNHEFIAYVANEDKGDKYDVTKVFLKQFLNAKTFGSLIKLEDLDINFLIKRYNEILNTPVRNVFETSKREHALFILPLLLKQSSIMKNKYDILAMNPPYIGSRKMNNELTTFLKTYYPDSKSDIFASFMELDYYLKPKGLYTAVNQHSWMFLTSYEKLREKVIENKFIDSLVHLGPRAFEEISGEVVQSTAFVLRNKTLNNIKGTYLRLTTFKSAVEKREKILEAAQNPLIPYRYSFNQEEFNKITGSPIAYWVSEKLIENFKIGTKMGDFINPKVGLQTGGNDLFLRYWWEPSEEKIKYDTRSLEESVNSGYKWVPYNKGGERRQWYGNYDYVINWENNGFEIRNFKYDNGKLRSVIRNSSSYFKQAITWSDITSGKFAIRFRESGSIHDVKGMSAFHYDEKRLKYALALSSTKVVNYITKILNPTISMQVGDFKRIPVVEIQEKEEVIRIVDKQVELAKKDWDSFEDSWDFKVNPLIDNELELISEAYTFHKSITNKIFDEMKSNEEKLNKLFIDAYGLQNELSPYVMDKDITVTKIFNSKDDIGINIKENIYILTKKDIVEQLISYAVGCVLGRYSLDEEGLIFAGGKFESERYQTIPVDEDNIIPILSDRYFEDDVVSKFIDFMRITFSKETLEENLKFIAEAIGSRKNETARETLRRYFLNDFQKYHNQMYKKRPIYWLFTSGKEKAFNCLIYMHRYDKTTLSRIRTDYLHEVQTRMDSERTDLLSIISGEYTTKEINQAKKELKPLERKIDELIKYDELLHHMADQQIEIDLDDGVILNYDKFKGLVAKR